VFSRLTSATSQAADSLNVSVPGGAVPLAGNYMPD